jgi:hypothetical protein
MRGGVELMMSVGGSMKEGVQSFGGGVVARGEWWPVFALVVELMREGV